MRFFLVFFLAFCTIQSYAQRYVPDQAFSLDGRVSALQIEGRQAIATSEGTAYFFEQQDDRQWVPVDTVSSPVEDEFFGSNVSLAANRAMIAGGNSAYIYEKRGGIWTLISQLDDLGEEEAVPTVAISEDYAFAGLSQEDGANGEQRVGVVIVFAREIQDWQEVQRLRASNGGTNEFFGSAVIVQGRQLVIGNSTFLDSNAPTNGAYLFSINERGEWLETETLEGFFQFEDSANPAYAFNQGNVAIGNSGTFASGFNLPGEVIIYEQQNNAWQQTIIIRPSDSENNDNFGREVVLFRNQLAVQTQNKGTYLYENTKFSEWEEIKILQDYYIADVSSRGAIAYGPDPNSVYFIRRLDNPSDPVFVPSQSFSLENSMRFATTAQLKDDQAIVNGGREAYIFEQQANKQWLRTSTLRAPISGESFGSRVAISKDVAIVAATAKVYIYEKGSNGSWNLSQQLDNLISDNSVPQVAIGQDYAFAAFRLEDGPNGEQLAGLVIVFKRIGQGWQEVQKLYASDAEAVDLFGSDIELIEGQLLVGNSTGLGDSRKQNNSAYLFSLNEAGEWVETEQLEGFFQIEDSADPRYALSPGNVAIGNSGVSSSEFTLPGEVIIYEQQNDNWQQSLVIQPFDSENNDDFGTQVILSGDLLAVQTQSKGTYLYNNPEFGKWEEVQILRDYYVIGLSDSTAIAYGPEADKIYFLKRDDDSTSNPIAVTGFNLIDPTTDEVLQPIQDGDMVDLNAIFGSVEGQSINIQAVTNPMSVGSVILELSGGMMRTSRQNAAPYALFGDDDGDYRPGELQPGQYTLTATPYPQRNFEGTPGTSQSISFTITKFGQIIGLTLINANREEAILEISEETVIDYADYPGVNFNLRVDVSPEVVGSVDIKVSEEKLGILRNRTENAAPYAAFGDSNGNYRDWQPAPGIYTVEATSYELRSQEGQLLDQRSFTFEVIDTDSYRTASRTEDTSTKPTLTTEIQLYPNPVRGQLQAEVDHNTAFTLSIYNPMGQLVYQKAATTSLAEQINFTNEQPGIYMVVMNSPTERVVRKVMVKK